MNIILLALSGLLVFLSYPPFDFGFLGYFALIPYFYVVKKNEKSLRYGFFEGTLIGTIIFLSILHIQSESILINILIFLLLVNIMGITFMIYTIIVKMIYNSLKVKIQKICMISLGWMVIEFITNKMLVGFTFYAGITQHNNDLMLYLSKYIGLYGISFVVVLINVILLESILKLKENKKLKKNDIKYIIFILGFFLAYFVFNSLNDIKNINGINIKKKETLKVRLIQGNITAKEYKKAEEKNKMKNIFEKYMNLSIKNNSSELIVWPETAVHRWIMRIPEYKNKIINIAKTNKINILFGTPDLEPNDEEYNSAFLISKTGKILGKYNKNYTVPFYENYFKKGKEINPFEINNIKIGVEICFEAFFQNVSTELKQKGAGIIFLLSNNGLFGYSNIPYITSAFMQFRAAENNVYVAQLMNTGITQIINNNGKVLKKTKLFETKIINYEIPVIYKQFILSMEKQHIITILFLVIIIAMLLKIQMRRRKK
ncbi:apolipoprotein N-acyltransferase [Tepiditoga spiralis]|uniref:Apolipoprotein N-acyltransferase n=1 Tax=Tepiditoga spiralis TaxID=2108365 RepID=A0A7G1G537_9BACT|nr:nitrilase-related carbon-nitrogen hydrolase [Tepiditoga spiralis]BBE29903.1 apolipoprotein N-acyltransferase [Tepiditoga spiralis]